MKQVTFCGRSLDEIKRFPDGAKREAGHQLDRVQRGLDPLDWKPMPSVGTGVREIRVHNVGHYRIIYLVAGTSVLVLHAFRKKTRKTSKHDIQRARIALRLLDRRGNR